MLSDGPMCSRDWPEGDDARRAVRALERDWEDARRVVSLDWSRGVERVERVVGHDGDVRSSDELLVLVLVLTLLLLLVSFGFMMCSCAS